jgi:hypothetical protein
LGRYDDYVPKWSLLGCELQHDLHKDSVMPTPVYCEGYEHQELSANDFGSATAGIWEAVLNAASMSFVTGRRGGKAVRFASIATTTNLDHRFVGSGVSAIVVSFYFRISGTPSALGYIQDTGRGGTGMGFQIKTDGTIVSYMGGVEGVTGPNVSDNVWHRLTFRLDTSANPWVLKWSVDGVAQTDDTLAQAADTTSNPQHRVGHYATATGVTFDIDDMLVSFTAADYDELRVKDHMVRPMYPNGDGTHSFTPAGDFLRTATSMDPADTNAWLEVDDWITGVAQNGDYIADALGSSGEYVEITFDDATEPEIWFAQGQAAMRSADVLANAATVRIVNAAGGTVADIFAGDWSETTLHFRMVALTANPSTTDLNGYKCRFGFATDVDPDPWLSAVMLQYAVPQVISLTGTLFQKAPTFPTGKVNHTIKGVLFQKAGTFPQGSVSISGAGAQQLTGVLFVKAATFPQGVVGPLPSLTWEYGFVPIGST